MTYKKATISALLLFGIGLTSIRAQESILTSGGNASGVGGSASYSVGQIVYTTNAGTNGSVAQGVQQPFEISVVTGMEEEVGISLSYSAYPNPTTDFLTLEIEDFLSLEIQSMTYQLLDINGKLLENKKIESSQTQISTKNLAPGIYFLKLVQTKNASSHTENAEIKTFKIIKN